MGGRSIAFAGLMLSLLLAPAAPAAAQTGSFRLVDHDDLLFSAVTTVNELVLLGDTGYAAATQGGLVIWSGEGARKVVTRTEGLPSSIVNSVALTGSELLVGTEHGAALVDLEDFHVTRVRAEGDADDVLSGPVFRVRVDEDRWLVMRRDGNLSVREDGVWRFVERPPGARGTDLFAGPTGTLLALDQAGAFRLGQDDEWSAVGELGGAAIAVLATADEAYVGLRGNGVQVFDEAGSPIDVGAPEALGEQSVLAIRAFGDELWLATTGGIFIHGPERGAWRTIAPRQLPHPYVADLAPLASVGLGAPIDEAVLATPVGLAWPDFTEAPYRYQLHTTVNGPATNVFIGLSTRAAQVWAGTNIGSSVFYASRNVWEHIGQADGLDAAPVYKVVHSGERAWMATNHGVYGLDLDAQQWLILVDNSALLHPRNIFYDVEQDGDILWMPELGNALIKYSLTEERGARYEIPEGLISHALTCAARWHEFLAICTGEGFQLFDLTTAGEAAPLGFPHDFCVGSRCGANYPAINTFDALPDASRLWTATVDAGVVLIMRDGPLGDPVVVDHWSVDEGLPSEQVRSLALAENGVWVGTKGGLARIDLEDGVVRTWGYDDGLDALQVNGLAVQGSTLFVSTLAGLYRLDIPSGAFLPLVETDAEIGIVRSSLHISFPPEGATLRRAVNASGSATAPGRVIELIEARIDQGPWTAAEGLTRWSVPIAVDELASGPHVLEVRARAADDVLAAASRAFTVARPTATTVLPELRHDAPDEAIQGTVLPIVAQVQGERPIAVTLEALLPGATPTFLAGRVAGGEASFGLSVPEDALGDIAYRFHLQTGSGGDTYPPRGYYVVPILEPRVRQLVLRLDADNATLEPGATTTIGGVVTNRGNRGEDVRLVVTGLRTTWAQVEPARLFLPPGQPVAFDVRLSVPAGTAAGSTVLLVNAQAVEAGLARSAPLSIEVTPAGPAEPPEERSSPGPAVVLVLVAVGWGALGRRRARP